MIRDVKVISIADFSGGVNNARAGEIIDDDQFIVSDDFSGSCNFYYKDGCIKKIKGYRKVNGTEISNSVGLAGYRWYFTDIGSGIKRTYTVCAFKDKTTNITKIYYYNGVSFVEITGGTTLNNPKNLCFASWKNSLYIASGVAPIQKITVSSGVWNRTNLTPSTMALTNPSWIVVHKDRLWINGTGTNEIGQIECSGYDDDQNWSGTEGEIFNTNYGDGDPIVALKPLGDKLVIYKYNSIWILEGDNLYNWIQRGSQKEYGCIAPFSIQEVKGTHIFLGEDNMYMFDGQTITAIGDDIRAVYNKFDRDYLNNFVSCLYDQYYYLTIKTDFEGFNNKEILLSIELLEKQKKAFFFIKDRPVSFYIPYTGSEDTQELYGMSSKEGYLYELNHGYTYDDKPITCIIQTKFFNFGAPNIQKELYRLRLNTNREMQKLNLTLIKNSWYEYLWNYNINIAQYGTNFGYWDVSDWDEVYYSLSRTHFITDIAIPSQLDCYSCSIVLSHSEQAEFELYNITLLGTLKEM